MSEVLANRRQGFRIEQDRPVKVYDPRSRRYYAGRALQLGVGGMRLMLPAMSPVQTGSSLQVYVGHDEDQVLVSLANMTPVRVVWIEKTAGHDTKKITVGVELALLHAAATKRSRKVA